MTTIKQKITNANQRWHLGRWAAGLVGLVLLLAALSWAFLPGVVKRIAAEQVQQQIGRKLDMADIRFSPFKLALTIEGLTLYEADQRTPAVKVRELVLNLSLASAFRQALIVDEVRLTEPYVHIIRTPGEGYGRYNYSDILEKIAAMPKSESTTRFSLANLQLAGGRIEIDDKVVNEQFKIEALQIGVPFVSNFPNQVESFVEPLLSAKVNGSNFVLKGRARPFTNSLDTSLAIDLDKLDLTQYLPYVPVALPVKVQNAKLSTKLDLIFSRKNAHAELLLAGDVNLDDLHVNDKSDAPLLKLGSLHAQIKQVNVMTAAASISKLELTSPEIWLDINQQGQLNWASLTTPPAPATSSKVGKTNTKSKEVPVTASTASVASSTSVSAAKPAAALQQLAELQLSKGILHFRDAKHANPAQTVNLKDISLNARGLSSAADAKAAVFKFALSGENDESLKLEGEMQPLNGTVKAQLALSAWSLATYQPLLSNYLLASVSGKFDVNAQLQVQKGLVQVDDLGMKLSQFAIKPKSADDGSFNLKALTVDKLTLNMESRQVNIGSVLFDGLVTDVRRDEKAVLNLNKWLKSSANANVGTSATVPAVVDNVPASSASAVATTDWKVKLSSLDFKDSAVSFNDKSMSPEVKLRLDAFNLHAEKLSSDMSQPVRMTLQTNIGKKSKLSLDATANPQLKNIMVNLDGQALPVSALFPYVSPYVNAALTRGRADIKGKLSLINALDNNRQINYEGMLALNDFHLLENGAEEDFLEWKNIAMEGISAQIGGEKQLVTLKKLVLNDFYARAILSSKGKLNIQTILSTKKADAEEAEASVAAPTPVAQADDAAAKPVISKTATTTIVTVPLPAKVEKTNPVVIRVAQTTLSGGNINFTDNFVKPNYTANLTGVAGTIGAIASDNPQAATIELTGKVDDDAPLVISGTLNPLSNPIFMDVKASANGLELTRLTPYAAKYAGYIIEKGKLSMQVSYRIENQQLQAENDVRLDQLTFGERVDSPTATKLPVMLAVALLRDNQGRISINLPITGSLSDPQFSVGGIIFKVFMNVITKAVTSPFALLGSMFGGGEELAYTEFLPGQTALTPATTAKLDSLAKALKNRAGLKLDIIGRVEPVSDADGIRQLLLMQKMRELKWKEVHQKDRNIKKDDISISDAERAKYVEDVYQAEKFIKPRNAIGLAKTLPTAEAEKMILANTQVTPDALRSLAQKRADAVRDYLEDVAGIERDRLFLIAPRLSSDGIKDKGSPNRVDFSLK
ncbi:DUF748 domain-containing protein [Undibacterium pigrum]|uniref:Uncharacterized protein involved in outer membrane biogenesis n=1 Tax=Undibacterium pigrum TaxID=401470 RepID=A0A318IZ45_9BURK|nr:DUF748 domain-containing protein [Undibacterium pigrum]PXX39740.1 uncharacterized protein involved in outer membrane biogenesis [Undibacterium pigrum]